MLALDERHWWYRGRRRVLAAVLDGLPLSPRPRILDAGCGSGRTLDDLCSYGEVRGIELDPLGVEAARARGHDVRALRELRRVTKPGGRHVVTVPAHPRLWSQHDVVNGHRRRYTRRTLERAAGAAGWEVQRMSGFNVAYLLPAALVRIRRRDAEGSELELTPPQLDAALELPLRAEAALVRRGANLPPGLSLLAVLA